MSDRELLQQALDALDAASSAIVAGMCFHENTHRGGILWTICDDCGQEWADDRGGFKKPTMPKGYVQAQQAASAIRAALGVTTGVAPLSDEQILHLWDTHVAYETGFKGAFLSNKDKLAFARAVLAADGVTEPRTVQCKQCLAITNEGNGCAQPGCPVGVREGGNG